MLQEQIRDLPAAERRKLMAFLVSLDDATKPGYAEMLAARIDDSSPARWLTPEECERRLGLSKHDQ